MELTPSAMRLRPTTMIYVHLAGADVDADHAIHSPIHRLGLAEIIKPVPVVIPGMIQPRLFE